MQPLLQRNHLNFEHDSDDHEDAQFEKLTPREHEIARLTTKGFSNKEIARILEISPHTVSRHLQRSFDKLGVQKRAALSAILAKATVRNKWDHALLS
jgi:RNA polymerase sigma factor (sigma-70 family)